MNRRDALRVIGSLLAAGAVSASWAVSPKIIAVRAWPGKTSTRLTIESDTELKYLLTALNNPDRAVLDLNSVNADVAFQQALDALKNDTGVLKKARIGQFKPDTARLVLELKSAAETTVFTLRPVGRYQHRLVIDFTPSNADDQIASFLTRLAQRDEEQERLEQSLPSVSPPPPPPPQISSAPVAPPAARTAPPTRPRPSAGSKQASSKPVKPLRQLVVALDPGHGGEDPGATGPSGTYEKDVVLAIAHRARLLLEQDHRISVFMTREEDVFIPLAERVRKARAVNADVFVSIHADAFTRPDARGSSVYALSERGATSTAAKWIADQENQSDLIGGVRLAGRDPALAKMILEMSQNMTNADSMKLAKGMIAEIRPVNQMHKSRVEQAGFAVLRSPDVPSILIETAFISNPEEEQLLNNSTHQQKLARAIRSGVRRFLASLPQAQFKA